MEYSGKILNREEADEILAKLQDRLVDLLDEGLIDRHKRGEIDAGSVIYIATSALCNMSAFILLQQLEDLSKSERLIEAYVKMFRLKAQSVLDWRKSDTSGHGPKATDSVWD